MKFLISIDRLVFSSFFIIIKLTWGFVIPKEMQTRSLVSLMINQNIFVFSHIFISICLSISSRHNAYLQILVDVPINLI